MIKSTPYRISPTDDEECPAHPGIEFPVQKIETVFSRPQPFDLNQASCGLREEGCPFGACVQNAARLLGIPHLHGISFVKGEEIIRCEGMQRLTKVVTTDGSIISSYNIGEFCILLKGWGFFLSHKSHLINLNFLRNYDTEGIITLRDGSSVPLARRRREAFMAQICRL